MFKWSLNALSVEVCMWARGRARVASLIHQNTRDARARDPAARHLLSCLRARAGQERASGGSKDELQVIRKSASILRQTDTEHRRDRLGPARPPGLRDSDSRDNERRVRVGERVQRRWINRTRSTMSPGINAVNMWEKNSIPPQNPVRELNIVTGDFPAV